MTLAHTRFSPKYPLSKGSLAPRLSTRLAPRLSTRIAHSKALNRLARSEALYKAR